jgi:hypothetical protein
MDSITTKDQFLSFSEWAKLVNEQKNDILVLMSKSDNPLNRVIAKDILKTSEVKKNDYKR